jgi:hypothetical protein
MSQNRIGRTAVAVALFAGAWGTFSTAHAQASGTLQASVTVLDDAVNRALAAQLQAHLTGAGRDSQSDRPRLIPLPDRSPLLDTQRARAVIRELPAEGAARHVRIDVVYLQ